MITDAQLKNVLEEIVHKSTIMGPLYTYEDPWGAHVIKLIPPEEEGGNYTQKEMKLNNYYVNILLPKNTSIEEFKEEAIKQLTEENKKMFKVSNFEDLNKLTCHQLCEWSYLEDESGHIIRDVGDNFVVNLAKYCVVIDKNCNEI